MGLFSLKPDPVIGLDIGSTAVKLLELKRSGKSYRVESYAMEPLPDKAVEDKNIVDAEVVAEAIRRVIRRAKPSAQHAAIAVSGPGVITKVVAMDGGMPDEEMKSEIESNPTQYLGVEKKAESEESDIFLDFQVIGPNEREPERVDVLLAAARAESVTVRTDVVELGGMKTRVVDIEKYALENALILLVENEPEIDENEAVALVEIGATMTTMYVLGEKRTVYMREETFGGRKLSEDIQHRYGLGSFDEAEMKKREGGLPDDYESEILDPFKAEMAQQISRLIQYYYSSSTFGKLSHILLAGGCACIPGVVDVVNEKVGGNVSIANPFSAMSVSNRVDKKDLMCDAPALMLACGLALRTFD